MHPFVASGFAVARRHLADARLAQDRAMSCLLDWYGGGVIGKRARRLWQLYDGHRSYHLAQALEARARAKRLRTELRQRVEADTVPPSGARAVTTVTTTEGAR